MASKWDIADNGNGIDTQQIAQEVQNGLQEEIARGLTAALEEKLHALRCPVHGPLTGLHIELSEDLTHSEVVGTMCCEQGLEVLNAASASDD